MLGWMSSENTEEITEGSIDLTMKQSHIDKKLGFSYGSLALFSAILHNVFLLYHVELFVSVYKIDKVSFWVGETVFLFWNSFNDPLFGWLSDRKYLTQKVESSNIILKRLKAISWNGPLFGLSFLAFWFSWGHPSIQFVVCLCLYDSFLTMIDLHHSALLADLAVSAEVRTRLNSYCSLFSAVGSLSVFISYAIWHRENLFPFQAFCGTLTLVSVIGFFISTNSLQSYCVFKKHEDLAHISTTSKQNSSMSQEKASLKKFIKDLFGQSNFVWFSLMNLVQVFHCHFNSNFFPLFLENLLGDSVSSAVASALLGLSFIAPHINNLYFLSLCRQYGVYSVIRGLFIVKLFLSVFMLFVGPNHTWVLCLFIASNRVFTEGTCKLLNLVISDLVDEDFVLHHRKEAVSALMFGTAALLSKPGQTLAPLIGTWLLSIQTGHDVFQSASNGGSMKVNMGRWADEEKSMYRTGVFHMLVYVPIICATLQLLVWSQFSLKGKRLKWVKEERQGVNLGFV